MIYSGTTWSTTSFHVIAVVRALYYYSKDFFLNFRNISAIECILPQKKFSRTIDVQEKREKMIRKNAVSIRAH